MALLQILHCEIEPASSLERQLLDVGNTDSTSSATGQQPPASEPVRKLLLQRQLQLAEQEATALRAIVSLLQQELCAGLESGRPAAFDAGHAGAYAGQVKDRLAKAVAKGRLEGKELHNMAEDVKYVIEAQEDAVSGRIALVWL